MNPSSSFLSILDPANPIPSLVAKAPYTILIRNFKKSGLVSVVGSQPKGILQITGLAVRAILHFP